MNLLQNAASFFTVGIYFGVCELCFQFSYFVFGFGKLCKNTFFLFFALSLFRPQPFLFFIRKSSAAGAA